MSGNPVRELMERYRGLCEQAVDPLDIAVGLEDAGLGPVEARCYRHADVFALAEELYARFPRRLPTDAPVPPVPSWRRRGGRALGSALRYGLPCAAPVVLRAVVPAAGVPLLALALVVSGVRPVRSAVGIRPAERAANAAIARRQRPGPRGPGPRGARLGYGLGVGLLLGVPVVAADPPGAVLGLAAALGMGSVEWSAGWLRHAALLSLGSAATLSGFRSRMRPVLPVALGLHLALLAVLSFAGLAALTALDPGAGAGAGLLSATVYRASALQWAAQAVLGLLLVPSAVLLRTARTAPAAAGVLVAGCGSAALAAVRAPEAGRLLCCGAVAAVLLPYAWLVLGRPGAYRPDPSLL
ncbi:hypothetical protein [Kitasatospora sp. GP82]|uniref:hypothetical protein n=1 Tax=Kitasatospora sp. GP82 TaxID=3035089 RepID=UPI002473886D|nr:hypothetical protein [Kitasatospora sp. GP82]